MLFCRGNDHLGSNVSAKIDHGVTVIFKHDLDNVFANIVNVTLNGGNDHLFLFSHRLTLWHCRFHGFKGGFGGICRGKKLRQEGLARFKSAPHLVKCGDNILVHNGKRRFFLQKLCGIKTCFIRKSLDHRTLERIDRRTLLLFGKRGNIVSRRRIKTRKHAIGAIRVHHHVGEGIHNCSRKTCRKCHRKECTVDSVALGQTERNVRNAKRGQKPSLVKLFYRTKRHKSGVTVRRNGQSQRVKDQIFGRKTVFPGGSKDLFGNGNSALHRLRNTAFVKRQRHHHTAVFLGNRENGAHTVFSPVDRIEKRLAVVKTAGFFHCLRIGGIDLQGRVAHLLQQLDHVAKHLRLAKLGKTHVHVKHHCALVTLRNAFGGKIAVIPLAKRRLQLGFAGGVKSFANQNRLFAKGHGVGVRRDHAELFGQVNRCGMIVHNLFECRNMLGRCTTASACKENTVKQKLFHLFGKRFGGKIIYRLAVADHGKSRIGRYHKRNGSHTCHTLHKRKQRFRAKAAVHTKGRNTKTLKKCHDRFHVGTGHQLAALVKCHGGNDRKIAVFLGGKNSRLELVKIPHCFDQNQVCVRRADLHRFGKDRNSIFKIKLTERGK